MASKVVYFKSIGAVTFFRNRRSKNIKISVKPDNSVLISFPFSATEKQVLKFLSESEPWIREKQHKSLMKRKEYKAGDEIKTKMHHLELHSGADYNIDVVEKRLRIFHPDFGSEAGRRALEDILERVYRVEAHLLLPERLKAIAHQHGFRYNKVTIRNNRRNWGSCSSVNNISLNLQMMKLPDELIDYILLHELVHTEIKDHSERFWKKLDECSGFRARELAQEVKKYSTYTL